MGLYKFCQTHLGQDPSGVFATHIERVRSYLADADEMETSDQPDPVVAAFRKKGLIPWWLMVALRWLWKQESATDAPPTAQGLAVCFAACVFPQRAFQMEKNRLSLRITRFLELYRQMAPLNIPLNIPLKIMEEASESLAQISRGTLSPNMFEELIDDLSGQPADFPTDDLAAQARRNGAALYLATCPPDLVARIYKNWANGRSALHCVTRSFYRPPSQCHESIRTQAPPEDLRTARYLEYLARSSAHGCMPAHLGAAANLLEKKVEEFWETQRSKLTSGFPYFSFQSSFITWWKQCLNTWDWKWREEGLPVGDGQAAPGAFPNPPAPKGKMDKGEEQPLTHTAMQAVREGYRFIRYTFGLGMAAAGNEQRRAALDELWFHRALNGLLGHPPTSSVQAIAERFATLGSSIINNQSNRLRVRQRVYALARISGLSNLQLLERQRQEKKAWARKQAKEASATKEKAATFTIASLARAVPVEFTLLWAFTAWVFLRPLVDPQHAEVWDFRRYVRELWHWVTEPHFAELLLRGAMAGRRVDMLAYEALHGDGPLGLLARELLGCEDEAALERHLKSRDPAKYASEEHEARILLEKLIGPHGSGNPAAASRVKQMMERLDIAHWVVPVWYATFVERLVGDELLTRLVVDQGERNMALQLAQAMRTERV